MRRPVLASLLAGIAFLAPSVSAAGPQVTDPANDANFVNHQNLAPGDVPNNNATPAGTSQAWGDVISVQWTTLKTTKVVKRKKVTTVTGFQVRATLSGPPKPPEQTTVVYRMLGSTSFCEFFGVAYYSKPLSDTTAPQSALRDNCGDRATRLTKLALPVISGSTMTWTVPLSAIPKDAKVGVGTALTGLYFTVTEIQDLQGQKVPDASPVLAGATGTAYGLVDDSLPGDATYRIGS